MDHLKQKRCRIRMKVDLLSLHPLGPPPTQTTLLSPTHCHLAPIDPPITQTILLYPRLSILKVYADS